MPPVILILALFPGLALANHHTVWYNVVPSDDEYCCYYRPTSGSSDYEYIGATLGYKDIEHVTVAYDESMTILCQLMSSTCASTLPSDTADASDTLIGATSFIESDVDTIGLTKDASGDLVWAAYRDMTDGSPSVIPSTHTAVIFTLNAVGYTSGCQVYMGDVGASEADMDSQTLSIDNGISVTFDRADTDDGTGRISWTCGGTGTTVLDSWEGFIPDISCGGASLQYSLIGDAADQTNFPTEMLLISGCLLDEDLISSAKPREIMSFPAILMWLLAAIAAAAAS